MNTVQSTGGGGGHSKKDKRDEVIYLHTILFFIQKHIPCLTWTCKGSHISNSCLLINNIQSKIIQHPLYIIATNQQVTIRKRKTCLNINIPTIILFSNVQTINPFATVPNNGKANIWLCKQHISK